MICYNLRGEGWKLITRKAFKKTRERERERGRQGERNKKKKYKSKNATQHG